MKEKLKTAFGKARQSKSKWLSVMLTICMVFALCPIASLTAFAAPVSEPDSPYRIYIYDGISGENFAPSNMYSYHDHDSMNEDGYDPFGRTYHFSLKDGTISNQARGGASVSTITRPVYEGDVIRLQFGSPAGTPHSGNYLITYNYDNDPATEDYGTLGSKVTAVENGKTEFVIPDVIPGTNTKVTNLTITAIDNAWSHPENTASGGAWLYVLNINISERSTTVDNQSLENFVQAVAGDTYPYTGTAYTPFSSISQYVTVTGGTASATNVGNYTVTLKPTTGYKWSDKTGAEAYAARSFSWSIVKSTPAAPAAPSVTKTNNFIIVNNPVSNQLYSIDGKNWYTAAQLASNPFVNLEEGKEYTVSTKIAATATSNESAVATTKVTTDVTIKGKISGDAVALPAEVTLNGADGTYKVITDANGNYSTVVPVGTYSVTAAGKDGLQAGTGNFTASAANKTVLEITMKDTDKGTVKKFVDQYLTGKNGNIYTAATDENYNQILSGKNNWDKLTPAQKNMVNRMIGTDYDGLLTKADELKWNAKIGNTKYETLDEALAAVKSGETVELLRNPKATATHAIPESAAVKNGSSIYTAKASNTAISVDTNRIITLNSGSLNCKDTNGTPVSVKMPEGAPLKISSKENAFDITVPETGAPYVTFPSAEQDIEIGGVKFQSDMANGKMYLPNPLAAENAESGKITAQLPSGKSVMTKDGTVVTAPQGNKGTLAVTNNGVTVENANDAVKIGDTEYTAKADDTVIDYSGGAPILSQGAVELDKNEPILVGKTSITNTGDAAVIVTADEPAKILIPSGGKVVIDGVEYTNDGDTALELPVRSDALDFIKTYLSGKDGKVYNEVTAENYTQILSGKAVFDGLDQVAKDAINALLAKDDAGAYNAYAEYLTAAEKIQNTTNAFVKDYLSDKDGNIYTAVSSDNYSQILSGRSDWNAMSDAEKAAVNAKLKAAGTQPDNYPDMMAAADEMATGAADSWKEAHKDILAKDADSVTDADMEAIDKALEEYAKLTPVAQEKLSEEKAKLDSMKAAADEKATDAADAWKEDHKDILAKDADSVTDADMEAIDKALEDYDKLFNAAKEKLTAEKAKLDAMKVAADEKATDVADEWKADHKDILSKNISSIKKSDLDAIKKALEDYEKLSPSAKAKLSAEKAQLDAMKAAAMKEANNPQTGDNSNMMLWLMLMLASGAAFVTMTAFKRKENVR